MAAHLDNVVLAIVYVALGLTAYVVVVGGVVCIVTDSYSFEAYIQDLRQMSNWVLAAAIVVAAKLLAPQFRVERRHRNGEDQ